MHDSLQKNPDLSADLQTGTPHIQNRFIGPRSGDSILISVVINNLLHLCYNLGKLSGLGG